MSKLRTNCVDCGSEEKVLIKTNMRIFATDKSRTEHITNWLCESCNIKVIKIIKRYFLETDSSTHTINKKRR